MPFELQHPLAAKYKLKRLPLPGESITLSSDIAGGEDEDQGLPMENAGITGIQPSLRPPAPIKQETEEAAIAESQEDIDRKRRLSAWSLSPSQTIEEASQFKQDILIQSKLEQEAQKQQEAKKAAIAKEAEEAYRERMAKVRAMSDAAAKMEISPLSKWALKKEQELSTPAPDSKLRMLRRATADPAISFIGKSGQMMMLGAVGIGNIFTRGHFGKWLENIGFDPKTTIEILEGLRSPESREATRKVQSEKWYNRPAEYIKNPSALIDALLTNVPAAYAMGAVGRTLKAIPVLSKLPPLVMAAISEGLYSAGVNIESWREPGKAATPKMLGYGVASGMATALISLLGGKLGARLGFDDVDIYLSTGAPASLKHGKIVTAIYNSFSEGFIEECPQSILEQIAHNLAINRPWHENALEAGIDGAIIGLPMGGAVSLLRPIAQTNPELSQEEETLPAIVEAAIVCKTGSIQGYTNDHAQELADRLIKQFPDVLNKPEAIVYQDPKTTVLQYMDLLLKSGKLGRIGDWLAADTQKPVQNEAFGSPRIVPLAEEPAGIPIEPVGETITLRPVVEPESGGVFDSEASGGETTVAAPESASVLTEPPGTPGERLNVELAEKQAIVDYVGSFQGYNPGELTAIPTPANPGAQGATAVAERLGLRVVWFDGSVINKTTIFGAVIGDGKTILMNRALLDNPTFDPVMVVLAHETTHAVYRQSKDNFNILADAVRKHAGELAWLDFKRRNPDLPEDQLINEFVAKQVQDLGADPNFWKEIFAEKDASFIQSILQALADMARRLFGTAEYEKLEPIRQAAIAAFRSLMPGEASATQTEATPTAPEPTGETIAPEPMPGKTEEAAPPAGMPPTVEPAALPVAPAGETISATQKALPIAENNQTVPVREAVSEPTKSETTKGGQGAVSISADQNKASGMVRIRDRVFPYYTYPEVDLASLEISKNVKSEAGEEAGVKGKDRIRGEIPSIGQGRIIALERKDGRLVIVTGRHRLDAMRRNGMKTAPIDIVRETDGFTEQDAANLDAKANILDGQLDVKDATIFFRRMKYSKTEAHDEGLLSTPENRIAFEIAEKASDDFHQRYTSSDMPDSYAKNIVRIAPKNNEVQMAGYRWAIQNPLAGDKTLVYYMGRMLDAWRENVKRLSGEQLTFDSGADFVQMEETVARMVAASLKLRAKIKNEISTIRAAGRSQKAGRAFSKYEKMGDKKYRDSLIKAKKEKLVRLENYWLPGNEAERAEIMKAAGLEPKAPTAETPATQPQDNTQEIAFSVKEEPVHYGAIASEITNPQEKEAYAKSILENYAGIPIMAANSFEAVAQNAVTIRAIHLLEELKTNRKADPADLLIQLDEAIADMDRTLEVMRAEAEDRIRTAMESGQVILPDMEAESQQMSILFPPMSQEQAANMGAGEYATAYAAIKQAASLLNTEAARTRAANMLAQRPEVAGPVDAAIEEAVITEEQREKQSLLSAGYRESPTGIMIPPGEQGNLFVVTDNASVDKDAIIRELDKESNENAVKEHEDVVRRIQAARPADYIPGDTIPLLSPDGTIPLFSTKEQIGPETREHGLNKFIVEVLQMEKKDIPSPEYETGQQARIINEAIKLIESRGVLWIINHIDDKSEAAIRDFPEIIRPMTGRLALAALARYFRSIGRMNAELPSNDPFVERAWDAYNHLLSIQAKKVEYPLGVATGSLSGVFDNLKTPQAVNKSVNQAVDENIDKELDGKTAKELRKMLDDLRAGYDQAVASAAAANKRALEAEKIAGTLRKALEKRIESRAQKIKQIAGSEAGNKLIDTLTAKFSKKGYGNILFSEKLTNADIVDLVCLYILHENDSTPNNIRKFLEKNGITGLNDDAILVLANDAQLKIMREAAGAEGAAATKAKKRRAAKEKRQPAAPRQTVKPIIGEADAKRIATELNRVGQLTMAGFAEKIEAILIEVLKHNKNRTAIRNALVAQGIDNETAHRLAKRISLAKILAVRTAMAELKRRYVERNTKTRKMNLTALERVMSAFELWEKAANPSAGDFFDENAWGEARNIVEKAFGFKNGISRDEYNEIMRLYRIYEAADDAGNHLAAAIAQTELQKALALKFNRGIIGVLGSYIVINKLTGMRTHKINIINTGLRFLDFLDVLMRQQLWQAVKKRDISYARGAFLPWQTVWASRHQMGAIYKMVMKTGTNPVESRHSYQSKFANDPKVMSILEYHPVFNKNMPIPFTKAHIPNPLKGLKYFMREMRAMDMLFRVGIQNAEYVLKVFNENLELGKNISANEAFQQAAGKLGIITEHTDAAIRESIQKAEQMGLKGGDKTLNVMIDMLNKMDPEVRREIEIRGAIETFNSTEPEGFFGMFSDWCREHAKNPLLWYSGMFSRVASNVVSYIQQTMPVYSHLKLLLESTLGRYVGGKHYQRVRGREFSIRMARANRSLLILSGLLYLLMKSWQDADKDKDGIPEEEPFFDVWANGPKGPAGKIWRAQNKPNMIKIGDFKFKYSVLGPLAAPLYMLGYWADRRRDGWFDDPNKELTDEQTAELAINTAVGLMTLMYEDAPGQFLLRLTERIQNSDKDGAKKLLDAATGAGSDLLQSMIPYASFVNEVEQARDPQIYRAENYLYSFFQKIPFVRQNEELGMYPLRNILGVPVATPNDYKDHNFLRNYFYVIASRLMDLNKDDPEMQFLVKMRAGLKAPTPAELIVPEYDPKKKMWGYRNMTGKEYDDYKVFLGEELRDRIKRMAKRYSPEEIRGDNQNLKIELSLYYKDAKQAALVRFYNKHKIWLEKKPRGE